MRPTIYKNVKELTYGELIEAISNIKEVMMNNTDDESIKELSSSEYYKLLVAELDSRQREV